MERSINTEIKHELEVQLKEKELEAMKKEVSAMRKNLSTKDTELAIAQERLHIARTELAAQSDELAAQSEELVTTRKKLSAKDTELAITTTKLSNSHERLQDTQRQLDTTQIYLATSQTQTSELISIMKSAARRSGSTTRSLDYVKRLLKPGPSHPMPPKRWIAAIETENGDRLRVDCVTGESPAAVVEMVSGTPGATLCGDAVPIGYSEGFKSIEQAKRVMLSHVKMFAARKRRQYVGTAIVFGQTIEEITFEHLRLAVKAACSREQKLRTAMAVHISVEVIKLDLEDAITSIPPSAHAVRAISTECSTDEASLGIARRLVLGDLGEEE